MEPMLDRIAAILTRHPSPALPLDEVLRHLASDGPGVQPSPDAVLRALATEPSRFRVVRALRGSRALGTRVPEGYEPSGSVVGSGLTRGPWVIGPVRGPEETSHRGPTVRIRAAIADLGRKLDEGSAVALARWLGLLAECGRLAEPSAAAGRSGSPTATGATARPN